MSRVVAVSNRVAAASAGKSAGGLAVGILSALRDQGGIWFGWSGKTTDAEPGATQSSESDGMGFVTVDLNAADFDGYYNGLSNNTLWPLLHFMLGYFSFSRSQYGAYMRVNEFLARRLVNVLEDDDLVWVHDYHLFPLGMCLRQSGVKQPIGFFLHVPFPNFDVLRVLPTYPQLLRALAAYDVVGFQTERDLWSFQDCLTQPEIGGRVLDDGRIEVFGRKFLAAVFPIGIDVDECQREAVENMNHPQVERLAESLGNRKLIIGVDRLDLQQRGSSCGFAVSRRCSRPIRPCAARCRSCRSHRRRARVSGPTIRFARSSKPRPGTSTASTRISTGCRFDI